MRNRPEFLNDRRFLRQAVAVGLVGDGREVVVYPRLYNSIVAIGRVGNSWIDDFW